ncbi:hypothetical protein [Neobacillus sp. NPDC093127]|uniref:hypothetical protein n=1 Tax=Neobacillus sp. NPDC093127 TaxID=3364296 RepID=UPI0037F4FBBE
MKKILTLLFTILVLTACTEVTKNEITKEEINKDEVTYNNYKFIGESEHWEAEYIYKGTETWGDNNGTKTYSNEDNYEFVLKFKGSLEELSSMRNLKYSYKTISSGGESERDFDESPREIIFTSKGSSNGAKVSKDEVIQVNVKWDKFEESFELHNKNM